MKIEDKVAHVIKLIDGIENRLNTLLEYAEKTDNVYLMGFVEGLCDFINKEMEVVK